MRKFLSVFLFLSAALWAQSESVEPVLDSVSAVEPAAEPEGVSSDNREAVEAPAPASAQISTPVPDSVSASVTSPAEAVKAEAPAAAPAQIPAPATAAAAAPAQDTVKKSGGLLDALYPVAADEAIAKGRIFGGATLSLIQGNTDDDALNVLIGDVYEGYGYTFTVEAFGGYFIKDAMALGLRAGYSRTWFDIDFSLMEDLMDLAEHRKYVSNGFFIQPVLKNYLKVFDSRNIYFFNETSISVEYSYGVSQSDDGNDVSKSRNRAWSIEAGINPGICIMVLNRFAFETSVGLLGLSSSIMEVEENGETHSEFVYNIVNFTINLLALDFSLVYFF